MSYIFFAFIAAILFAISVIINKFISKHRIKSPDSLFVLSILLFLPTALVVPFIPEVQLTFPPPLFIFFYSIFFTLGVYLFSLAIYSVDVSVAGPLFQIQGGLIVILSAIFLGERFPLSSYFWIALLIFGAMLVSLNDQMRIKAFFQKGIILLLGMQIFHAISNIFVGFSLKQVDYWNVIFFGIIINAFIATVFYLIKKPRINYPSKITGLLFLGRAFSFFGAAALFRAFQDNLSISGTIGLLSAPIVFIVSILASRFSPKLLEHHSPKVYAFRGVGLLIILFGAIKLAVN